MDIIEYKHHTSGLTGQRRILTEDVQQHLKVFLKNIFGDVEGEKFVSFYIDDGWIRANIEYEKRT